MRHAASLAPFAGTCLIFTASIAPLRGRRRPGAKALRPDRRGSVIRAGGRRRSPDPVGVGQAPRHEWLEGRLSPFVVIYVWVDLLFIKLRFLFLCPEDEAMMLARRAIKHFPTTEACPRSLSRSNQRKWLAAVSYLGDHWILSKPVERRHARNS